MFPPFPLLNKVIQKLRYYSYYSDGRDDTHRPLVAVTTVVSTSTSLVCGPLTLLSILPRPAVITGIYLEQQVVSYARMEALMQHYQAAGFSKEVSKLATANWATGKGFDPLGPTAAQIAAFLYKLFDAHDLLLQTIKGYKSCLASVLGCTSWAAEVQAKTISDMIMSLELQRPRLTLMNL